MSVSKLGTFYGLVLIAFVQHYYDARTDEAAGALARVYVGLDRCKSQLELSNQTLHDVIGVYDTQEPGYQGNSLLKAFGTVGSHSDASGQSDEALTEIEESAAAVVEDIGRLLELTAAQRPHCERLDALADLELAERKVAAHAHRQKLMIDTQSTLKRIASASTAASGDQLANLARRWETQRKEMESIRAACQGLYSRGDPLGLNALLKDMVSIQERIKSRVKVLH